MVGLNVLDPLAAEYFGMNGESWEPRVPGVIEMAQPKETLDLLVRLRQHIAEQPEMLESPGSSGDARP